MHAQSSLINKCILLQQFYEFKINLEESIANNVTHLETLVKRLKNVGENISASQLVTKVICSLLPSYKHVVAAWNNIAENEQTLDTLMTRLLKEETLAKQEHKVDDLTTAFQAFKSPFFQLYKQNKNNNNNNYNQQQATD